MIPYGKQHIDQEDIDEVVRVLQSDFLTQGPAVARFEESFKAYVNSEHAVAVSNGTAALHLAVKALGIKPGQKVITTPITFAASANCVLYNEGQVDFVDIDPETALIDIDQVEQKLSQANDGEYAGIIPVNFAGKVVDMEKLRGVADKYGVWILEDACHTPGGYFIDSSDNKILAGSCTYSDATVFSFHPVKHIACGEGGMVTTRNKDVADKVALYRTHGVTKDQSLMDEDHGGWYYEMVELGYNYRISDIQCALGYTQLKKANAGLARRQEIAQQYDQAFAGKQIKPLISYDEGNAYHLYVVLTENRKELYDHLRSKDIFPQVHYIPLHYMPVYKEKGWKKGDLPNAENYYEQCLSIPMYPTLSQSDQQMVIESILNFG